MTRSDSPDLLFFLKTKERNWLETKNMNIQFSSALSDIKEINPSFDTARLRIAYTGKNRNNSFISREAFERAIPSMYNCPVVANYIRDENEIGSHDGEFINNKDGEIEYINITQPVGIVPESASYDWETVDDNGVIHQYLCTDVILWKRQEAYQKIIDNGITDQSMEIAVTDGEIVDGYYDIRDFHFTAFCLLGTAEPCFESAALFTFSNDGFKQQYIQMMKEFKAAFSDADVKTKEGENGLDRFKELLAKYQLEESELDFDYSEMTDEELENMLEEFADRKKAKNEDSETEIEDEDNAEDPAEDEDDEDDDEDVSTQSNQSDEDEISDVDVVDDTTDDDSSDDGGSDFALNSQIHDAICAALFEEEIEEEWGSFCRYWLQDYDLDKKEVYFYDKKFNYTLYGAPFGFDGDDVIIEFEKAKRKKYVIEDYIEGESEQSKQDYSICEIFKKFNEICSAQKQEIDKLSQFEQSILTERRKIEESALFEKFDEELKDCEEYKILKSNSKDFTLEELEKELFALVGKMNFSLENKKSQNKPIVNFNEEIQSSEDDEDEFGGLFAWTKNEKND